MNILVRAGMLFWAGLLIFGWLANLAAGGPDFLIAIIMAPFFAALILLLVTGGGPRV